ncbi:hypothetical protein FDI24_gp048 [Acidovorax phage ACP17]|uniref:Uncharacterized protein n=1 Tax=Acidovorax phage ACP17 TaxID=2010329 RepID=A0A218M3G6_9CAUD|nr:hypothetical protein FDI24_gp048 [Acidovorax phage ACP17]ASD50581.1 hypothetical protein [Acidovorax phage ACP17]
MALILNQAQAEAVYSAMRVLNNIGTVDGDLTLNDGLRVQWLECVTIRDGLSGPREIYANQSDFASAYGLLPLVEGVITVRADGEANRYTVIRDSNRWVAGVQLNGEYTVDRQQAMMARFAEALQAF